MSRLTRTFLLTLLLAGGNAWAQEDQTSEDSAAQPAAEQAEAPDQEAPASEQAQASAPEQQQPSLEQAYQREYAFLQGQKRDLEQRLARLEESIEAEKSKLQSEIDSLETEVVDMRGRADRLDELVLESERSVEAARENSDVLASTFTQADFTLEDAWSSDLGDEAPGAGDVRGDRKSVV